MAGKLAKIFKGDLTLWVILIFLSLISLVIVYSATGKLAYREAHGNTMYYLIRQVIFILVGFGIMLFVVNVIPVSLYFKISPALIGITVFTLILAFIQYKITGGDKETSRSLTLPFFSFQPAELAKISLVMYAARLLSKAQRTEEELKEAFYWITGVAGAICFLIFLSNFSTAALIFFSIIVLMLIARVAFKYVAAIIGIGAVLVVLIYFTADLFPDSVGRVHTVKSRIETFISGSGKKEVSGTKQEEYARLAIFEGGVFGKGPGNSEVSNYMEAGYNDFIYSIYIEEYGFVGGAFLVLLYLILLFRGVIIVRRCDRTFPAFMVTGLVLIMTFQAFINMAVSVGAVPVTGQPLPWVSMGGSSMLFTAASFGVILAVSADNQKRKFEEEQLAKAAVQPVEDAQPKEEAVAEENAVTETKSETEDQQE
ncbi:MAG TPA: FtsW/RodA/SpoVE family cell cycle protein [Prolixibacteraceae bacterium]|nr:FtsW/RodA/SpoVE family cell cycle protein [Prolixibacteraceae bacterium]HPR84443.1 FtsW/RodA/SpoVE family cell cycle protein [Prolixibacteraceae bacterium]